MSDDMTRGEAKAAAAAAKARAKSMRPWYRKKRFIIPLAFVVLIALISIGASGGGDEEEPERAGGNTGSDNTQAAADDGITGDEDEADDVKITRCETGQFGMATLGLEVVNDSSKRSSYLISITIEDAAGTKVGEAFDVINNVEPGQKAVSEPAASMTGEPESITCRLTDVDRTASD